MFGVRYYLATVVSQILWLYVLLLEMIVSCSGFPDWSTKEYFVKKYDEALLVSSEIMRPEGSVQPFRL